MLKYPSVVYLFILVFIFCLFAGSWISAPKFNSDPGLGFLDLIHFKQGGKFAYHQEPAADNPLTCVQTHTTWWSPGQWFFVYLVGLTGLSLGKSISVAVLIATLAGIFGWMKVYRKFGFTEQTVLFSGILILLSRYFFSSFQLYPGASILEFAAAPWIILLWLACEQRSLLLQLFVLLLVIPAAYFVKSSMLIFILGLVLSTASVFRLRSVPWKRIIPLLFVFLLGKYFCDWLYTGGGATPFSYPGHWIVVTRENMLTQLQGLLFTLTGPFLATIGMDDYISYFLQKPGSAIFPDGHPVILFIYLLLALTFLFLIWHLLRHRISYSARYTDLLLAVCGIFIAFFLYSFLFTKIINAFEESRHFRVAGLLLLPLVTERGIALFRRLFVLLPVVLFIYACMSYAKKFKEPKVISVAYQVPFNEMSSEAEYQQFRSAATKADIVYVVYAEQKYELDHCKTIYNQDDFITLEVIRARPKIKLTGKQMVFLLPHRFATNGKRDAILENYVESNPQRVAQKEIRELPNWELITVNF